MSSGTSGQGMFFIPPFRGNHGADENSTVFRRWSIARPTVIVAVSDFIWKMSPNILLKEQPKPGISGSRETAPSAAGVYSSSLIRVNIYAPSNGSFLSLWYFNAIEMQPLSSGSGVGAASGRTISLLPTY